MHWIVLKSTTTMIESDAEAPRHCGSTTTLMVDHIRDEFTIVVVGLLTLVGRTIIILL